MAHRPLVQLALLCDRDTRGLRGPGYTGHYFHTKPYPHSNHHTDTHSRAETNAATLAGHHRNGPGHDIGKLGQSHHADPDATALSHADSDATALSHANPDATAHTHANPDATALSHTDATALSHTDFDATALSHANPDATADTDGHRRNGDSHANAHTHASRKPGQGRTLVALYNATDGLQLEEATPTG